MWDVKSCGLLCCWSRGGSDPPVHPDTCSCLQGIRSFSSPSPPHSSQSLPALPGPPGSPGALRGPWRPGSSPEGCDLDPCPQSPRAPTGVCCGGSCPLCPLPPSRASPLRLCLLPQLVWSQLSLPWAGSQRVEGRTGWAVFGASGHLYFTPATDIHTQSNAQPSIRGSASPRRNVRPLASSRAHSRGRARCRGGEWHPVL